MKKSILFLTYSFFLISGYSQHKNYFMFSSGIAVPNGQFAKGEFNLYEQSGFAKTGVSIEITIGHEFGQYKKLTFGALAQYLDQIHETDPDLLNQAIKRTAPNRNWTAETTTWKAGGMLLGGYSDYHISNSFQLELKAIAGMQNVTTPAILLTEITPSADIYQAAFFSATIKAPSFKIGGGIKFGTDKVIIGINIDFFDIYTSYSRSEILTEPNQTWHYIDYSSTNIETLNFNLGLGFKF